MARNIPYYYDRNFNLIVETADLFRSKGFQKQLEACVKLDNNPLESIRRQGYEAHDKGRRLTDNPNQSHDRREAWKNGWLEAENEYLALLSWNEAMEVYEFYTGNGHDDE